MKIALVHMRLGLKGGLETRLYNYVHEFRRLGHEVTVVTSKITGEVSLPKDVHIIKIDLSSIPKPVRQWFFVKKLEEALQQYRHDLVLSMSRSRSQDVLIAPTTHRGWLYAQDKKLLSPIDWMINRLEQKAFESSPVILACSEMIRQEIIQMYGISAEKVQVLYPPLNTDKFKLGSIYSKSELRAKFGLPADVKLCVFVSTSHKRKGLPLLLDVFKELEGQGIHLAVAGTPFQSNLPNVHSLGFVVNTPDLFHAADMALHPAIYEPFGQVVSEAIACGLQVLVGPHVGAKEVINDKVGVVVPDYEVDSWKESIMKRISKSYVFDIDFVYSHNLSLKQHCEAILEAYHHTKK